MAENYDVPIDVKFTTDGDSEAVKAIEKVADAGKSAQETGPLNKQSVEDEIAGMKEKEKAALEYAEALGKVAKEQEKGEVPQQSAASRRKEVGIAIGAIGTAAAMAAKTLSTVREGLESIDTVSLAQVDAEMAGQIDQMKLYAQAAQDPIGALLTWIHGESVADAFKGLNDQLALNMAAHGAQIDRMIQAGIRQTDELKRLADEVKAAEQILNAKQDADSKARDRADAAAVRGGADKFEVAKKRAEDEAKIRIDNIDQEVNKKAEATQKAYEEAQRAKVNQSNVEAMPNVTREDVAKATAEVSARQAQYEQQKRDFETAQSVAAEQRRGVREGVAGRVEGLTADQSEAAAAAKAKAEQAKAKADAAAAKQAADALRESQRAEMEAKRVKLAGTAAGNQAQLQGKGKKAGLKDIGNDIGNADTEAEIAAVGEQIKAKQGELGTVTVAALTKMLEGQAQLVKEIEILKQKIRNN